MTTPTATATAITPPQFKITGFRSFTGTEGYGFNAVLHVDGVKAAFVRDMATGGDYDFDVERTPQGRAACQKFLDHVARQPEYDMGYGLGMSKPNADMVMAEIVEKHESARRMARLLKTKTVYRLKSVTYKEGEYHTIKALYSPEVKAKLMQRHGDDLLVIMNEGAL